MSDAVNTETGEITEGVLVPVEDTSLDLLVKDKDKPSLSIAKVLDTFDWRNMKPHQMAMLLMQKPFTAKGGGTYNLNFTQALFYAVRCYELGLSPFGNETFFDPAKCTVGISYEGKKMMARNKGIDLGPPQYERKEREWAEVPDSTTKTALITAKHKKDIGYLCKIRVGDPKHQEFAEYLAWGSEWYVSYSPVWKEKFEHMLQTRAAEKATTLAMGTGASGMPEEAEIGA